MYACTVCFTTALWLPGLIICFGPLLLTVNSGRLGFWCLVRCWLAPAISFLLEAMPLLLCLFLRTSVWRLSLMLFLSSPTASLKGLGAVSFWALETLWWMWVSGCWKAAVGGSSTTLNRDRNSPAELRARDDRRSMSAGGKGRGRVTVITEIVRKRRNTG